MDEKVTEFIQLFFRELVPLKETSQYRYIQDRKS